MQKLQNPHYPNATAENYTPALNGPSRAPYLAQGMSKATYSEAFNLSKKTGRNLWELLSPVLPDSKNKELSQTMEIALYQWMLTNPTKNSFPVDNVPFLTGMQFNEENSLSKTINIPITANRNNSNTIELLIPAINPVAQINAPVKTKSLTLKIMAASYNIANGSKIASHLEEISIQYTDTQLPSQNIFLPATTGENILTVIAMSVEYVVSREDSFDVVHNLRWMPSGIIWSAYN